MKQFLISLAVAAIATGLTTGLALAFGLVASITLLELAAVFTSYSCTYLCVMQSRWNYPIGVLSTGLYSILFWTGGLYGLAVFNAYLVCSLIYGYWRWGPDGNTKDVSRLKANPDFIIYPGIALISYGVLILVNFAFGVDMAGWDIVVSVLSAMAQFMLDNKKLENWIVWGIVNVISIALLIKFGMWLAMMQSAIFLANVFYGWYMWKGSMR